MLILFLFAFTVLFYACFTVSVAKIRWSEIAIFLVFNCHSQKINSFSNDFRKCSKMSLNRENAYYSCFTVFFLCSRHQKGASKGFLRLLRVLQSFFGVKGYFLVFYSKKVLKGKICVLLVFYSHFRCPNQQNWIKWNQKYVFICF